MLRVEAAFSLPLLLDSGSGICSFRSIRYSVIDSKSCLEKRV